MTKEIDFYFDFISPYSYLAHQKIKSIKNVKFNYKPVLVGGLHNLQGITAPAFIKPKLKHMISDCDLIAKKDKSSFIWNSKFPINSLNIMRGYLFINVKNRDLYLNVMFDAYWKDNLDISNEEIIKTLIKKSKIEPISFFDAINDPKIKEELKIVTQEAHDKEIFGAPTFVVNNKIFWGQDRLEFALDEYNK
ncbi:2-hydroxychromene-2-carboxylate isomerase [Candidatus Pelagibacter sp. Uisw_106]|uniref:2-hydroxychromene-2-carboxylate isomerase n=1 Tax=Candidatus Pelagibacter sp. Uisw_106 TaxID=3230984 RepID=UPI002332F044|nr:2-hydroxychromene-2-carboxylate isomerase [Candidatus Pelagibacter sp.]